jgi:hypothetical protein
VTRAKFVGITTTLTTTINALTATLTILTTQLNNNTTTNNNNIHNQNMGAGPIRVLRGGNNHIIKDSSSSKVEKTDPLLELLDQVEDVIRVDNDTVCDKTAHSFNSQDGIANELHVRANHLIERTKSHIPKEVVSVFSDSNYLAFDEGEIVILSIRHMVKASRTADWEIFLISILIT